MVDCLRQSLLPKRPPGGSCLTFYHSWRGDSGENTGHGDGKGSGDDTGHIHRKNLEEDARSDLREESTNHSNHSYFLPANTHASTLNKVKIPIHEGCDETKESAVHSTTRNYRDHSMLQIHHDAMMTKVDRTAHDDYRNCYRARRILDSYHLNIGTVMDRYGDRDAMDLHNVVH